MTSGSITQRVAAAQWLGDLDDERSEALLFGALKDEAIEVQVVATSSLAHRNPDRDVRPIVEALRGQPPGDSPYEPPSGREIIELGLYAFNDARPVPQLVDVLRDDDPAFRLLAARVLGSLGGPAAVEPLARLLEDHVEAVREAAIDALGSIGGESATDALERAAPSAGTLRLRWRARKARRKSRRQGPV